MRKMGLQRCRGLFYDDPMKAALKRTGLYETTMYLLGRSNEPLRDIAAGAQVKYDWLRKVRQGNIPEPSCQKMQRVHDYLVYG